MTQQQLMADLKDKFQALIDTHNLPDAEVTVTARGLTPEEAIGQTARRDFPILTGQEVMLQADYDGAYGQAFTDAPADFSGTLGDILALDLSADQHNIGLFVAALNAVMRRLGLIEGTVHCKTDEPELCAAELAGFVRQHYADKKIAMVGYQPSMLEALGREFTVRALDLSPKNVGQERYGVTIEHGIDDYNAVVRDWADVVLVTGSTLSNGSIVDYIDIGKDVVFFGITIAGAAELLGLKRLCYCGH